MELPRLVLRRLMLWAGRFSSLLLLIWFSGIVILMCYVLQDR